MKMRLLNLLVFDVRCEGYTSGRTSLKTNDRIIELIYYKILPTRWFLFTFFLWWTIQI